MLKRLGSWQLPLLEASALASRRVGVGAGRRTEILAVDDERYLLARAVINGSQIDVAPTGDDLTAAMTAAGLHSPTGSDFEGVACDGSGRVFVLQEGASRIVVVSADLKRVVRTIALQVRPDEPGFGSEWQADSNSRGEGLLLLRNGHVLVAKQKGQPRLVEFGPAGEAAGFAPGSALPAGRRFRSPAAVDFVVLASWPLAPGTPLESINDLAVDPEGRLVVVSSLSHRVARLTGPLEPQGGFATFETWELDGSLFDAAGDRVEGLVWLPSLGWLVALDLQRLALNLIRIGELPS